MNELEETIIEEPTPPSHGMSCHELPLSPIKADEVSDLFEQMRKNREDFDDLVKLWIDEYLSTDGQYMFRISFVEQLVADLITYVSSMPSLIELLGPEPDLENIILTVWKRYSKKQGIPKRVYSSFMFRDSRKKERKPLIKERLLILDTFPKIEQKTPEWYKMRSELLTATAVSKLFFSEAKTNSVIYEKCQGDVPRTPLSFQDPRQWGNKYEPVTRQIYELLYHTKVKEYGCIQHSVYPFIGASPDGVNIEPKSCKYGRMIEIKNIVNREITGDPSEEYWIQMQIQMEVCDLDICDFVETRIKEFSSEEDYFQTTKAPPNCQEQIKTFPREDPTGYLIDFHGVVLQFIGLMDSSVVHYEYMPLFYTGVYPSYKRFEEWRKNTVKKLQHEYVYVRTDYWYLDEISVVVVPRNRVWFSKALPEIERVWKIIEMERQGDYSHRKPASKKEGKKQSVYSIGSMNIENQILTITKQDYETTDKYDE